MHALIYSRARLGSVSTQSGGNQYSKDVTQILQQRPLSRPQLSMYLWWSLCTLYLLACLVKGTVVDSGLCCCVCVTSFQRYYLPCVLISHELSCPRSVSDCRTSVNSFTGVGPRQLWAECLRPSGETKLRNQRANNKRPLASKESAAFAQMCFVVSAGSEKGRNTPA